MATMLEIQTLKDLAAAYEAALQCDYCPHPDEAVLLLVEIETDFDAGNFRRGAEKMEGRSPDEIANTIVSLIAELSFE